MICLPVYLYLWLCALGISEGRGNVRNLLIESSAGSLNLDSSGDCLTVVLERGAVWLEGDVAALVELDGGVPQPK